MTSRLRFVEANHTYWLADADTGRRARVPSVSALKSTLYQFQNERWFVQMAAEGALDDWEEIAAAAPPLREELLKRAALDRLGYARDFGRAVHHYCEQLWTGEAIDVPEEYAEHVQSVADWWHAERVRCYVAEAMCFHDSTDPRIMSNMAGRLDLIVEHPSRGLGLLDIKTWTARSSGQPRPAEWAFQLAAYSAMRWLVVDDEDKPFPRMNWAAVLHVGPGGVRGHELGRDDWRAALDQVDLARMLKAAPAAGTKAMIS